MTTKYIYLLVIFLTITNYLESQEIEIELKNKVDSIYKTMSIDDKLNSILLKTTNELVDSESTFKWMKLDSILSFSNVTDPLFSDVLVRSALLGEKNKIIQDNAIEILVKNNKDGFYFSLSSPYSLLFQPEKSILNDFLLEPYGRVIVPYSNGNNIYYFSNNTFLIPENVQSSKIAKENFGTDSHDIFDSNYYGLPRIELLKLMEASENPSIETILKFGGFFVSNNRSKDLKRIQEIFKSQALPESILNKSCKKAILISILKENKPGYSNKFSIKNIGNDIIEDIYQQSQVLLINKGVIPINNLTNRKIASIHIGSQKISKFQKTISYYAKCDHFNTKFIPDKDELLELKKSTEEYNTIIVGVNGDWYNRSQNKKLYNFLHQISASANLILVHFGSGNQLSDLPLNNPFDAVLLSFEIGDISQNHAAQILFGGIGAKGSLAKNINDHFSFGSGEVTKQSRLGFSPINTQAYKDTLSLIDQIVYKAIRERATPGCQVLVAKNSKIIYNKAFGYHTYSKKRHVKKSDLYDIASITKITSATPSVMKLTDDKKLNIDDSLSVYLPRLVYTNKSGIKLSDMLIHQAGLEAWIPFYIRTIDKEKLKGDLYSNKYSSVHNIKLDKRLYLNKTIKFRNDIFRHHKSLEFPIKVCEKLYMNRSFIDSIKLGIDTSEVKEIPEYRYSDLGYYYLKEIIEKQSNTRLDNYVNENFYSPLGAYSMGYLPLSKFSNKQIVPTENDKVWRKILVHGFVHDPGAAMLGGIGGHAGVFSNAQDLAKILQMYLNYGMYGNERYIDSTTILKFTSVVKEGNRRGLGFDKPVLDPDISGPCSSEASPLSYGHSGFTGTLVWVDPKYDLIFIFLSNRIHPNQYNKKLIKDDVRTNIQSAIYRSLPEYWEDVNKYDKDSITTMQ